jgi:hypothetical protein
MRRVGGFRGTFLACTIWMPPTLWHLKMPVNMGNLVWDGRLTMVDCKFARYFIWSCMLADLLEALGAETAKMSSHCVSGNLPTVRIVNGQAMQAKLPMPSQILQWLVMRPHFYWLGPNQCLLTATEYPRWSNPSHHKEWRLCNTHDGPTLVNIRNGDSGVSSPQAVASSLTCSWPKELTNTWNEARCSWPVVQPCRRVSLDGMDQLRVRRLSEHYAHVDQYWQMEDLQFLGDKI